MTLYEETQATSYPPSTVLDLEQTKQKIGCDFGFGDSYTVKCIIAADGRVIEILKAEVKL
jgi:hypothetical protein